MLRFNYTIQVLILQFNDFGDEGARLLAEVLVLAADSGCLHELDLAGNSLGEQGFTDLAEALVLNRSLLFLGCSYNTPSETGVCRIGAMLRHNVTLRGLDLHDCGVNDAGAAALGRGLCHNATLTGLSLDHNNIGDSGLAELAEGLRLKVTVLVELDLRENRFEDAGIAALADALRFNSSLQRLYGVHLMPLVRTGMFRLSDAEIRSCEMQIPVGAEDNALLLETLRGKREFARLRHELNKEVVWGDECS
jgi:hypothetical protein